MTSAAAARTDLLAVRALVSRDLRRFFRVPSRVAGALVQPLLFWVIFGFGLRGAFAAPVAAGTDYLAWFYPGVLVVILLFTSIFSTMSVIEDRRDGFLQVALAAPASRAAVAVGKTLGGAAVALLQAGLFLLLCGAAGYPPGRVAWPALVPALALAAIGTNALGLSLAWWLRSTQGYHAIMSTLLVPSWVLSGAMFPIPADAPALAAIMRANPMSYVVAAVRRALAGGELAPGVSPGSPASEAVVLLALAAGAVTLSVALARRRS